MQILLRILLGLFFFVPEVIAEENIHIENAWISEAPPTVRVVAGYMLFKNNSTNPVELINASSPLFERIEFHLSSMEDGIAKMRKQENVTIPAQSEIIFSPGHYHLMLFNSNKSLVTGDEVPIELQLSDGRSYHINAEVKRIDMVDHHNHH